MYELDAEWVVCSNCFFLNSVWKLLNWEFFAVAQEAYEETEAEAQEDEGEVQIDSQVCRVFCT